MQPNWSTSVLIGFGIHQMLQAESAIDCIKRNLGHLYQEEHPGQDYTWDIETQQQHDQPFVRHTVTLVPADWHESY